MLSLFIGLTLSLVCTPARIFASHITNDLNTRRVTRYTLAYNSPFEQGKL